jgi:hypothetical protein
VFVIPRAAVAAAGGAVMEVILPHILPVATRMAPVAEGLLTRLILRPALLLSYTPRDIPALTETEK